MPPPRFAELNGIRLCWYEVGSPDEERAVPVIFCHGFPELAFSWRHQLRALGSAGIWALAPDQRGYGLSSAPEDVLAYGMEELCGDLITLLDHIGADRAIWCGHDWGGLIVWHMALRHPDRTAGIIALNTPFMPRLPADPIQMLRASRGEDNYIVQFQRPGEADAVLNAHPREAFSLMMQRPEGRHGHHRQRRLALTGRRRRQGRGERHGGGGSADTDSSPGQEAEIRRQAKHLR